MPSTLKQHFSRPQTVASLDDATEAQKLETIAYEDKREEQQFLDLLDLCPNLTEKERQVLILVYYWPVEPTLPITCPCTTVSPTETKRALMWQYIVREPSAWEMATWFP